jgi:acyl-CoA synthetase (AMP-forming)/AMP-acid ligase II
VVRSATRVVVCAPAHEALVLACLGASRAEGVRVSARVPDAARSERRTGRVAGGPLLLQHSSGTTGLKKAVLLDERAVLAQVRHLARALRCDGRDVVVSWAPLYHDMGLVACLLFPLLADLKLVLMSPFDWLASPEVLLREVTLERGTLTWMPNFAFAYCAQRISDDALRGVDLTSWRGVVDCSEPVTARAVDAFHRRFAPVGLRRSALAASYAMAETTFAVTQTPPGRGLATAVIDAATWRTAGVAKRVDEGDPNAVVLVGSGELLDGASVAITGPDGEALEEGRAGEIRVRSDSLMSGYFGDTGAKAPVVRDGWYATGDVGVILGRELFVTGRRKDLVIVAGHNVYPHDVEESVGAIAGIKPGRVVALGVPDAALGTERLVVLAETDGASGDEASLRERVRAHVSSVFGVTPHDVQLYAESRLVKSTSGKLSRARNREIYLAGVTAEVA